MRRKQISKLVTVVLALAMAVTMIPQVNAQAAAKKTKIGKMHTTIPVGETGKYEAFRTKSTDNIAYYNNHVALKNKKKKAKYSYKSSNTKVLKVSASGYMTGVKAGTAKLSVYQKLSGKTTLVGTKKITVKNASFYVNNNADTTFTIGDGSDYAPEFHINELEKDQGGVPIGEGTIYGDVMGLLYRNPKAEYTFNTGSENLTIKMAKETYSDGFIDGEKYKYDIYEVNAKQAGDYNVEVTETYKGKTRSLGTHVITVYDTEAVQSYDSPLYEGQTLLAQSLFKHYSHDYDTIQITEGADKAEVHKYAKNINVTAVTYPITYDEDTSRPVGLTDKIDNATDMPYKEWDPDFVGFGEFGGISNVDYITFKHAGPVTVKCTGKNGEDYGSVSLNVLENTVTSMDLSLNGYEEFSDSYYDEDDNEVKYESGKGTTLYLGDSESVSTVDVNFEGIGKPIVPPVDSASVSMVSDNTSVATIEYKTVDDDDSYKSWVLTPKKKGYAHITAAYGGLTEKFDVYVTKY